MKHQNHKAKNKTKLVILAAIFILSSIIINQSGLFSRLRVDLTENDLFTLNAGTKNILQTIDEQVHLRLFFSDQATENIPMIRTYYRRVADFLEELERYGNGKLKVSIIDPVSFSEEEDQASQYGLQALPVGEGGENVFFGVAATNALDQVEILPFLQPNRETFLEYDLAQLIYNLNHTEKKRIGVMSDLPMLGDEAPVNPMQQQAPANGQIIFQQLKETFEVKKVAATATSFDDIDLLMVVHPKSVSDATLFAIDQFVMNGGRLMVFVDPMAQSENVPADPQNPMAQLQADRSSNLAKLLSKWGIGFDPSKVVVDAKQSVQIQSPQGQPIRHLAINSWAKDSYNHGDIVMSELSVLNTALAGSLTGDESRLIPLLSSTSESMLTDAQPMVMLYNPSSLLDAFEADESTHIIAGRLQGEIETAFPEGFEGQSSVLTQAQPQVVVVADVDMLFDRLWVRAQNFFGRQVFSNFADNGAFITNVLDNMTGSVDLIQIRARGTSTRPFNKVLEIQRESEQQYRETENQLMQRLRETEQKLNELQRSKGQENQLILSAEQQKEIKRFKQEKLTVRKNLREVKRNLNKDIEALGSRLKFINIALIPILLTIVVVFMGWRRSKRKERRYVK